MKQTLLLMVLALGMICINVSAQTKKTVRKVAPKTSTTNKTMQKNSREYKIDDDDGFEWYLVCKNGKYGAEDKNGNLLIPYEYTKIWYMSLDSKFNLPVFFMAILGDYVGAYSPDGRCIIPVSRKYTNIWPENDTEYGQYYTYNKKDGMYGICNANGKQLFEAPYDEVNPHYSKGKFFYTVKKKVNGVMMFGLIDGNGNIVIPLQKRIVYESLGEIYEIAEDDKGVKIGSTKSINTTENILAANKSGIRPSSSNSSSNNNSGGGTTTIVVEHQYTPQPVQEWQACFGCGGMGTMGCDNCGGSGTKYIGDRLHRCSRCNGQGIIPCNICYGSKGKYITVYR